MKPDIERDPIGFSYYQLSLLSFLEESHPERLSHKIFIKDRAIAAAQAYAEAFDSGFNPNECLEIAMKRLYKGLHFSKHDTIVNILWNEFTKEVDPEEAKSLAINLYPLLKPHFKKYDIDDDFGYSSEFESLRTELIGVLQLKLEEDGKL